MGEMILSDVMKKQTELAWRYLEKARPLITYEKLVPVSEAQIVQYELKWDKIVPPDYRYWLTTYGSGRIEFLEGTLEIVSIHELMESDGRTVSDGDPQNCWKRIYIGCSFAPVTHSLDSTIVDEHGCAPVIITDVYGNKVEKVLASSWPLYVIKSLVEIASSLKDRDQTGSFTAEQVLAVEELANQNMELIDDSLGKASERAEVHNNTKIERIDGAVDNAEIMLSMLDFLEDCIDARKSRKIIPRLLSKFTRLFGTDNKFTKAIKDIEDQIEKGYASLAGNSYFISNEVEPSHVKGVKALLHHDRRELREIAQKGWLRINPGEAENQAKRMWDWLKCAEDWLTVDKSGKEAVRCLREAEKAEIDISATAWRACAEFWLDKFHNVSEAHRCLLIAEKYIDHCDPLLSNELLSQSMFWIKLKELEIAKKNLLLAEETAGNESYQEMIWASQYWRDDLKDSEAAKRCLRKAESLVPDHHSGCLRSILKEWKIIGDKEEIESFKARNAEYLKD